MIMVEMTCSSLREPACVRFGLTGRQSLNPPNKGAALEPSDKGQQPLGDILVL